MARLLLTYKNKVIKKYIFDEGNVVTIGRHPKNTLVVDNPLVSSRHAKIEHTAQGIKLTDLNSTNGTYVNNEQVAEYQLAHQDWITIGKHIVVVDVYETLSLESTLQMLETGTSGTQEADHTMMLDAEMSKALMQSMDYLNFLSHDRDDFELSSKSVTIGKNTDAEIAVNGFWGLFAGEPAASIHKQGSDYFIEYVSGMIKPKVNGKTVKSPTIIKHRDIIKIGPIRMQLYRIKRTA